MLESTVGRLMFKFFIFGCMVFAVIYALPIAMDKVGQINQRLGGTTVTLASGVGRLPSIVDMVIIAVYVLSVLAGAIFLAGLLWGLAERITGHTNCRREIQEIKAYLGMED